MVPPHPNPMGEGTAVELVANNQARLIFRRADVRHHGLKSSPGRGAVRRVFITFGFVMQSKRPKIFMSVQKIHFPDLVC